MTRTKSGLALVLFVCAVAATIPAAPAADDHLAGSPVIDESYATACGPIAGFVASKALGGTLSLDELVQLCHWNPGKTTSFAELQSALIDAGFACHSARLSPKQLSQTLSNEYSVILSVRKGSEDVNHMVTAIACDPEGVLLLDYPELLCRKSQEELADVWDGDVLVVGRGGLQDVGARLLCSTWVTVMLAGGCAAFAIDLRLSSKASRGSAQPPS
jgi:Peptidase C39 family